MSQAINLCQDSDDNREWSSTNATSIPSLPLTRKRARDKDESSMMLITATMRMTLEIRLRQARQTLLSTWKVGVDVSVTANKRKRRGVRRKKQSANNSTVGKCAQILKGLEATEKDVGGEDAQIAGHRESHEGVIAATAASHPMDSDLGRTRRDDRSTSKHSQKPSTSEPPSKESGRQSRVSVWEDRLSELADYRRIHGHCNVPKKYSENAKLARWVGTQRNQFKLRLKGYTSPMTTFRIQELESLGFEWSVRSTATRELRLSELAEYRRIHGHCNVPQRCSENTKLAIWVGTQRSQYRFYVKEKRSSMTPSRIQELESLDFEWDSHIPTWEVRLSELADYHRIHGHCNVPTSYSESAKLASWVGNQRSQYRWHVEGKTSPMTPSRIKELESLGFKWGSCSTTWEDRLSELTEYRRIHGHCNVPYNYSENTKLAKWVKRQRCQYKLYLEGKTSPMTFSRIQALESLGFDWKPSSGQGKGKRKKPSIDNNATCVRERAVEASEHVQTTAQTKKMSIVENSVVAIKSTSLSYPKSPT
jgi:hypothetical protein